MSRHTSRAIHRNAFVSTKKSCIEIITLHIEIEFDTMCLSIGMYLIKPGMIEKNRRYIIR